MKNKKNNSSKINDGIEKKIKTMQKGKEYYEEVIKKEELYKEKQSEE